MTNASPPTFGDLFMAAVASPDGVLADDRDPVADGGTPGPPARRQGGRVAAIVLGGHAAGAVARPAAVIGRTAAVGGATSTTRCRVPDDAADENALNAASNFGKVRPVELQSTPAYRSGR